MIMTTRHSFLICRAAAFAVLLITAGATSISVAAGAGDAGQLATTGVNHTADSALALAD